MLPEAEYLVLVEAAEDAHDRVAVERYRQRLDVGEEELIPSERIERLLCGENRVRVWRAYRGLSVPDLAARSGVDTAEVARIEAGLEADHTDIRALAGALGLTPEDLPG